MTEIEKSLEQYRNMILKKSYYIIALCVTAIGFSVSQTMDYTFSYDLVFLALSILSFCASVGFGFWLINSMAKGMLLDVLLKKVVNNAELTIEEKGKVYNSISKDIPKVEDNATNASKGQNILFFIGIALFITWRVVAIFEISIF